MRPWPYAWLVSGSLLFAACDALGNPPNPGGATFPTAVDEGGLQVITTAHSAPASEVRALLRRHPYTPQVMDRAAPPDGVFTLVLVQLRGALMLAPQVLVLRTTFTFHDREPITRRWIATGNSREVTALFGLPAPPRSAVTALDR